MDSTPYPGPSWFTPHSDFVKSEGNYIGGSSEKGKEIDEGNYIEPSPNKIRRLSPLTSTYELPVSDYLQLQYANNYCKAAYLEVMTLAKEAGTWVIPKPALGNLDDLVNEFRTAPWHGKQREISVATAFIPDIRSYEMADMMMDVRNQWSKSLFPFVTYGAERGVTGSLRNLRMTDASIGSVIEVYSKMQLPSTLVPTRSFEFFRYSKEIVYGYYIIVDFSNPRSYAESNSRKRPSGVIIRDTPEGCEIICIENVEVDETGENMYSEIINQKLAYSADRCISTLLHNLKRDKSSLTDAKIDVYPGGRSFLLSLTEAMKRFFMECVSEHPNKTILTLVSSAENSTRILYNKTVSEDMTFVGVKSFRVQAKPLSVLQFLMKKDIQLEMFVDTNEVIEEPEQVFEFGTDDNNISLHRGNINEETVYILQEASTDEYCSFILSKTLDVDAVNLHIVCGEESIYERNENAMANMTPIGFAIMPDGPGGLQCDASLVTFLLQMYFDPDEADITVETVTQEFSDVLDDIIRELDEMVVWCGGKLIEF